MENQIKNAVAHFEKLLREQIVRAQNLNAAKKQKDENKTVIGLVDGDGIGPIIMAEAKRALEKLLADEINAGAIELRVIEGLTIENRLALHSHCNRSIRSNDRCKRCRAEVHCER